MWMHFISRAKICGFYLAKTSIIAWSNWICWIFLRNAHDDIISFLSFSGWLLGCYRPVVCVDWRIEQKYLREKKDLRQKKNLRQTKNKTKKRVEQKEKKKVEQKEKKGVENKTKKDLKKKRVEQKGKKLELYKKQRRIKLCKKKSLFYQRCCLFSLCASSECLCVLLEKVETK